MRSVMIASLVLAALGCGPEFAVIPAGGQERVISTVGPVTMTAFAGQWTAYPDDLADYVTPIAVELYNAGPQEVRVSYADFALRDERGTRFPAISPFLPASLGEVDQPKPILLAQRGGVRVGPPPSGFGRGGFGGGVRVGPPPPSFGTRRGYGGFHGHHGGFGGGGIWIGPPVGRRGYGAPLGGWSGYHITGGLRGYYGPGARYWGGPWIHAPYYSSWVFWWGPRYYPSGPSEDVLAFALPEGVIAPGGRVNGFLYFQKATEGTPRLELQWDAYDARTNTYVASARVALDVVRR
jgi:hypothetical protein